MAGNVKVGNRINLITRWQAFEYITSQNLDRRAFACLNCITIVPGAVGACRRSLLEQAGGWGSDTLAEDQELTLKIRRLGYRIAYEEDAIAWTEAPETVRDLAKQRFRWSFGTLQCMWKHRDALFRPKYGALGFIAMPNVWIFQILFSLISPVMDLMLIWAFVSATVAKLGHPAGYPMTNSRQVIFYGGLFLAVELAKRVSRLCDGEARTMEPALVVLLTTLLVPSGDLLRDDQICARGVERRPGRLEEIGEKGDCGDAEKRV